MHRRWRVGRPRGPDRADRVRAGLQPGPAGADAGEPDADPGRLRRGRRHRRHVQRADHRGVLRRGDHLAGVLRRRAVHGDAVGDGRRRGRYPVPGQPAVPVRVPGRDRAGATRATTCWSRPWPWSPASSGWRSRTSCTRWKTSGTWRGRAGRSGPGPRSAASRSAWCCWPLPQMYGVGYPVMYKAVAGGYVLWFLLVLAAGKMLACSLTLGIGGSGGVFAPSLFIGVTSGMAFGEIAGHLVGPGAGPARPVRGRRDGRGVHLRRAGPADLGGQRGRADRRLRPHPAGHARRRHRHRPVPRAELRQHLHHQAAAPRRRHRPRRPLAGLRRPQGGRRHAPLPRPAARPGRGHDERRRPAAPRSCPARRAGEPTRRRVYASESLAQTLRQLGAYGRDGLPVLSADGRQVQGWITNASVLQSVAAEIGTSPRQAGPGSNRDGSRPTRCTATRSSRSPWPRTRPPQAGRSAASPGPAAASRSPSCATAA